ncbi:Spy/CpxP family protein refolding chaperone [Hydrogenimonas cancrithermarum]|uniref:Periplasmic heavy metal sensor n=1 Tax=Hydrogenimonas cancrithermarum TaxID=2993563 RepID=A0ABM8FIE9_9BACT|nr:Spy/CpxP family protein refolding chaperone [Hydrogenimonas cancrithermarum]BDY12061.1 hypothetical protein HCR_03730 [Hydrogenimonas cancrithermarum]
MKTKLLLILLAASLGFNIFFTIGYFSAKKHLGKAKTFEARVALAAEKLSLDERQKNQLFSIIKTSREKIQQLKRDQKKTVQLFKSEFEKSSPDIERLKKAMRKIENERKRVRSEIAAQWKTFFESLSDKQRKRVMNMLARHPELRKRLLIPSMGTDRAI